MKCGGGDGAGELVVYVDVFLIRREGEVAWAGAGWGGEVGGFVRGDGGGFRMEAVDEDFIGAEVGSEEVAVGLIKVDAVDVGGFLALRVDAGAGDFYDAGVGEGFPGGIQADGGEDAVAVVGEGDGAGGCVEREVAGVVALASDFPEEVEGVFRCDGVGGEGVSGGGGVEDGFFRVEGEEAGAGEFRGETGGGEGAGFRIEFGEVDAFRVGSDVEGLGCEEVGAE